MKEDFLRRPRTVAEYGADAIRAIGVLSVLVAAIWSTPTDAGILALATPALMLPRALGMRGGVDLAIGVTVLVAAASNARPSSWSWRNLAPVDAIGRPRMVMFALPSPVDASERMPGITRRISAIERALIFSTSSARRPLVEVALSRRSRPFATPVENTSCFASGAFCATAGSALSASRACAGAISASGAAARRRKCLVIRACPPFGFGARAFCPGVTHVRAVPQNYGGGVEAMIGRERGFGFRRSRIFERGQTEIVRRSW